jgi:hypothetical protein
MRAWSRLKLRESIGRSHRASRILLPGSVALAVLEGTLSSALADPITATNVFDTIYSESTLDYSPALASISAPKMWRQMDRTTLRRQLRLIQPGPQRRPIPALAFPYPTRAAAASPQYRMDRRSLGSLASTATRRFPMKYQRERSSAARLCQMDLALE